ncbi:tetratricopeptide repeat protein [Phormidium sp. CCY1219]|uniref:tetratricopeptide repeat protein n=1 Tax=Phormidium sp. CCY1219 TaxID=2886104 RepID=UPI002D1E9F08|nr:tetratricopeptide repeat protein [Phormidium sp. CCY1219]MEB3830011.1 tetratricopeptide repeat protein [Phormidium sp. CCY1219]
MTFNFTSINFLSRTFAGTATLVAMLSILPGVGQAKTTLPTSSGQNFPQENPSLIDENTIAQEGSESLLNQLEEPGEILEEAAFYEMLGNMYLENEEYENAIGMYNSAIESQSEYAEAYMGRGIARARLGDKSGAIEDLRQAASLFQDQGNTEAYEQVQQLLSQVE